MSEGAVTIRTKKFITNRLLQRKQFVRERHSKTRSSLLLLLPAAAHPTLPLKTRWLR